MSENKPIWHSILDVFPLLLAAGLFARLWSIWSARRWHPLDLEWMEGGMLLHAQRVGAGEPLYVAPSADWIPFIYPPGYATTLGWLGSWLGLSHGLGRSLSLFGTLLAASALVFVIARQGRSLGLGLIIAGIFLGTYPESGTFFDLVRNDAMALGFMGWSLALLFERDRRLWLLSGLLLFVAFVFKHNMALLGVPMAVVMWQRREWRVALAWGLSALVPALLFIGVMQFSSGGMFIKYLVSVPAGHGMKWGRAYPGTLWELGATFPVLIPCFSLFLVLYLLWLKPKHWPWPVLVLAISTAMGLAFMNPPPSGGVLGSAYAYWLEPSGVAVLSPWLSFATLCGFSICILGGIFLAVVQRRSAGLVFLGVIALFMVAQMRGHVGGFTNVHMPAHWIFCLLAGLAGGAWRQEFVGQRDFRVIGLALFWMVTLSSQLGVQFQRLDSPHLVPRVSDVAVGQRLIEELRHYPGPVLAPFSPWLPVEAGHRPSFHLISLWDVTGKRSPFYGIGGQIEDAFDDGHWNIILEPKRGVRYGESNHYKVVHKLKLPRGALKHRAGWKSVPYQIRVPKEHRAMFYVSDMGCW